MKVIKVYGIQIVSIFIIFMTAYAVYPKNSTMNFFQYGNECESFHTGWQVSVDGRIEKYDELPTYITGDNPKEIILSRTIDGKDTVGFFTASKQIYVYLDEEVLLEFVTDGSMNTKTPGGAWLFAEMDREDTGKTLSIHIVPCYEGNRVKMPVFYHGTRSGIILNYLEEKLPLLLLSILGAVVGLILLCIWVAAGKKLQLNKGIPGLACFAIFIGTWSAIETNIYSFFYQKLLIFSWMSYMCLKMAVLPFLVFVNTTFHNGKSRVLHILAILSLAEFWITNALQFAGIKDYSETVFITHVILMIGCMYIIATTVPKMFHYNSNLQDLTDKKVTYMVHSICIVIVAVAALMDLASYYYDNSIDVAYYSRFGYFIYIIAVTFAFLIDFINLIAMGKQAKIIKEEASLDVMTRLHNRAAYEKDIEKPNAISIRTMGVIVCDLNNLKQFNDMYGHDMGDYYIIVSSEVIRDIFGRWGQIYRIGGDEFCCIVKNLPEAAFEIERGKMELRMKELHVPGYDLHMEISAGYAAFDADGDQSLKDTMKRADSRMYERKKELKSIQKK
ncbi:MAG: GGDEF domain-containing protein [Lachnospiraceae bacterium]|nr:GGDEF domain-containing protein [Lachnospiraceae bacterium]